MWYQGEEDPFLKPRRCPMPVPILCLDEHLRHLSERFGELLSQPQYQSFVIVLFGLMRCEGTRTLSGLLPQIADEPSLAELSCHLAEARWEAATVVDRWLGHFRQEIQPVIAAEQQRQ